MRRAVYFMLISLSTRERVEQPARHYATNRASPRCAVHTQAGGHRAREGQSFGTPEDSKPSLLACSAASARLEISSFR